MKLFEPRFIPEFLPKLLGALPLTLAIVGVATIFGLLLGLLLAVARLERVPVLSQISAMLVSFLRGTPVLVQLFLVYYGLPVLLKLIGLDIMRMEKIIFVYITYSLNSGAFFSECIRGAVLAVPKKQWDAAYSVGLAKTQAYRRIILPQSVGVALPGVGMTITGLLQDSSLAFSLGILDVMGRARTLSALNSRVLESYIAAAIIFVFLTLVLGQIFRILEQNRKKEKIT